MDNIIQFICYLLQ